MANETKQQKQALRKLFSQLLLHGASTFVVSETSNLPVIWICQKTSVLLEM